MSRAYDLIIVGAGLYGAVVAEQAIRAGKSVLILERRDHVGGLCHSYRDPHSQLTIHEFGAHIFHTRSREIWEYVNRFANFEIYEHRVQALVGDTTYPLPISHNTIQQFLGQSMTADEARNYLEEQRTPGMRPGSFEDKVINQIGRPLYEAFVKEYTTKQWGVPPERLPPSLRFRLKVRFSDDWRYFGECYQGVPREGYTALIQELLRGADVELGTDFFDQRNRWQDRGKRLIYTGPIDRYFEYVHGPLSWREITHELRRCDADLAPPAPVLNVNNADSPYTRIADYGQIHVNAATDRTNTILSYESLAPIANNERAYREDLTLKPLRFPDEERRLRGYQDLAARERSVVFGGRLADFQYYDMEHVVALALKTSRLLLRD